MPADRTSVGRCAGGFTLIEVLITLAIASVLSLLALPSFQGQVQRVRRSDALVSMIQIQLAQSRWRANGPVYASLADLGIQQLSGSGYYRLELDSASTEGYRLVATALGTQAGDAACRVFVLTVIGTDAIRSSGPDADASNDTATTPLLGHMNTPGRPDGRCRATKRHGATATTARSTTGSGRVGCRGMTAAAGLTLVELMVSLAIGLFLVAVGTTLLVAQLRENRSLLVEARLMQDLRTTADLMTRDLRRDGYWGNAEAGIWTPGTGLSLSRNPYQSAAPATAASDATLLRYSRDAVENDRVDSNEQFGYRLHGGTIELQLGAGNWQAITDAGSLTVTALQIVPQEQSLSLADACIRPCPVTPVGGELCPPHQTIRSLAVTITGHSVTDAQVVRSLRSDVRVRNDAVSGTCPTA